MYTNVNYPFFGHLHFLPMNIILKITLLVSCVFPRTMNGEEVVESEHAVFEYTKRAETFSLTLLHDLKGKDGATVKVLAKNVGGEDSCSAQLSIRGRAPTFIERPLKCTILEGDTAVFRCRIDGDPTPKLEWTKGKWKKMENNKETRVYYDETVDQYVLEMDKIKVRRAGGFKYPFSTRIFSGIVEGRKLAYNED